MKNNNNKKIIKNVYIHTLSSHLCLPFKSQQSHSNKSHFDQLTSVYSHYMADSVIMKKKRREAEEKTYKTCKLAFNAKFEQVKCK